MRLTVKQRLEALERDTVVLHDTIKMLHKLLREQKKLINDYIVRKVAEAKVTDEQKGANNRPEDALYTFVCKQRFDKIDRDIRKMFSLIENSKFETMAG